MKTLIFLIYVLFVFVNFSCGTLVDQSSKDGSSGTEDSCGIPLECEEEKSEQETGTESEVDLGESTTLTGYISNAFEVTVDGKPYDNLEHFFTHELDNLGAKLEEAGYDESFEGEFDAEIGFSDLWNEMEVFIAATADNGYQTHVLVSDDGAFEAEFPVDSLNENYQIRATKRIHLYISNDEESKKLCYNFSAYEPKVRFEEGQKPFILKKFTTSVTKYACESSTDNSESIEIEPRKPQPITGSLSKGQSREEVLELFGKQNLVIESDSKWCWYNSNELVTPICSINHTRNCQCYVLFDEDGFAIEHDNINSSINDVLSWVE